MSATKLSDLLPIPAGTRQPHPYQVFGLDDGEQDTDAIQTAIQTVISRLKAAKAETDPEVWKQAARLAKGAQETLCDPGKKAQLDARFGIVSVEAAVEPAGESASSDPLAALLPAANPLAVSPPSSTDPLAGILPAANPLQSTPDSGNETAQQGDKAAPAEAANLLPPGLFGTPSETPSVAGMPELADESMSFEPDGAAAPGVAASSVVVKTPPKRPRKRSLIGTVIGVVFALLAFAVVGGVLYFAVFKSGQVEITMNDDGISFSTQPQPGSNSSPAVKAPPVASDPLDSEQTAQSRDPIMGSLGNDSPSGKPLSPGSFQGENTTVGNPEQASPDPDSAQAQTQAPPADNAPPESDPSEPAMAPDQAMTEEMTPEEGDPGVEGEGAPNMEPEPSTDPASEPLSDEMLAEADAALERVRQLIQTANWSEMKPFAEATRDQPMSETQKQQAEDLFAVADLASYYRIGIERAIADLKIGNDFEVTEGVRVIIVETGPDRLVVRYDAKSRAYGLNELPWSLAHKLGSFSMPDSPATEAAKAVYQAVASNANQAYREQALQWLEELEGEVDGADPLRLAETIRSLFPSES